VLLQNTYVLKRKYEAPLYKKNHKPHYLKKKHFIYEVVEHVALKKRKPLDLILTKFVTGVGNIGTRVTMPPNRAYNKFLLPGLAVYATPENIEKYRKLATEVDDAPFSSVTVEQTMQYLSCMRILMIMSKDVPWTLEKWHVRTNFRKAGIIVPTDAITMPEKSISGPNLDIDGKEFYVTLTLNNCEKIKMRCCIYHWGADSITQTVPEFWKLPLEPIFPEDKPILDSLPPPWKPEQYFSNNV
jgi:large subunit ribosomal protein L9